jgi:hypothetical protein
MDNYEGAFETERTQPAESRVTNSVEQYAASIPSSAVLGAAVGVMVSALVSQLAGRGKWGNLIAQCVAACLIIGVYNKLVKLEGHDRIHPGHNRGYTS